MAKPWAAAGGIALAAGATARVKRLTVAGDPAGLIAALEKIAAAR